MYCAKCGTENPDSGRFCRKCGARLPKELDGEGPFVREDWVNEKVGSRVSGRHLGAKKKKTGSWEGAIGSIGAGIAFLVISVVLAFQPMGTGWWFWMLIPGFGALGSGIAQVIALRQRESRNVEFSPGSTEKQMGAADRGALPPNRTVFASEEMPSRYETGEPVPPSVTEGTTRHLEMEPGPPTTKLDQEEE